MLFRIVGVNLGGQNILQAVEPPRSNARGIFFCSVGYALYHQRSHMMVTSWSIIDH